MNHAISMIRSVAVVLAVALFVPVLASAQQMPSPEVLAKRGATIYAASCTGYCHGVNGAAGSGAPALANRGFDEAYIEKVVMYGVPNTAMVGWGQRIPKFDSAAVIAYVESLNGLIEPAGGGIPKDLGPEEQRGSALFLDSDGELTGCSTCHQVRGKGLAVTGGIVNIPADAQALRNLATPHVSTATVDGRTFPALVVSKMRAETKLYDLTVVPPVLLARAPGDVKTTDGGAWQHRAALGNYTDEQLTSILAFLRAVQNK
jgi:mono/diheme cytochrome c family protein